MAHLPTIYDLLHADFLTQAWTAMDGTNRTAAGGLGTALPEAQSATRPTAEWRNGVIGVLRQLSQIHTGAVETTALNIATTLRIPRYTTAGRPAAGTIGRLIYDTDLDTLLVDDGAAWDDIMALGTGSARTVLGRSANSAGTRADIAGSGTATAPQVLRDNGTAVEFEALSTTINTSNVAYEVDFSTLANNTITDTTETIDGLSWTGLNSANAGTFAIQNGTGLRISAATSVGATAFTSSTQDVPMIYIPLGSLPGYDPQYDWIVEVYMSTLTLESVGEAALLGLWGPASTPGSSIARVQVGGIRQNGATLSPRITNSTTVTIGTEVITTHNVMALKIRADRADLLTGVHSGSAWPTVYNSSMLGTDAATHSMHNHSSVRLALAGAFASDASPTSTIVYRSLRLRRI